MTTVLTSLGVARSLKCTIVFVHRYGGSMPAAFPKAQWLTERENKPNSALCYARIAKKTQEGNLSSA
jgi:hypothetical protein